VWLNWALRLAGTRELVGTVQATVTENTAELAWVLAVPHQGRGYAREAALAVRDRLLADGISRFVAHIHADHAASAGVARSLGMSPTDTVVEGEIRWTTS
jgi:RimJ/RimL family protein N-acetyltransferase